MELRQVKMTTFITRDHTTLIAAPRPLLSGFTDLFWFFTVSAFLTASTTAGIRVEPLTRMTSLSISDKLKPALRAGLTNWSFVRSGQDHESNRRISHESRLHISKKRSSSAQKDRMWQARFWALKSHHRVFLSLSRFSFQLQASFQTLVRHLYCWCSYFIFLSWILLKSCSLMIFCSKSSPTLAYIPLQLPIHQRHHHPIHDGYVERHH